ncbi:sulfatase [Maribacter sp. 1_MG-2023]|uniref:sulfatase n=1 Tax=Maribacter sp. 1_MG-2023 TaxID=3062677 RepID=UPI0026E36E5E|nr:sulfatase [Maribacter sp. 1_MG-2023]MDO6473349.1 sulfatase [Maribacter sp. 1_MG-2023]
MKQKQEIKSFSKILVGGLFLLYFSVGCKLKEKELDVVKEDIKPNILFIAIDDLRPELGSYGSEIAISPNLDKLSSEGLQFNNAYCQQAICGPSRASVLTGMRPENSGIIHNYIKIRDQFPDIVTLPQHFKENGYEAVYAGKIFHHGDKDEEKSWSRKPVVHPDFGKQEILGTSGFALQENIDKRDKVRKEMFAKYGDVAKFGLAMGPAYEFADVPDNTYVDGYNTDLAIATMKDMVAKGDKPFFLGLGMNKPHLNWIAPKKYWDLYSPEEIEITKQIHGPENGAAMGLHPSFELRVRDGIPKKGDLDPKLERTLMHAYLACISYVDAQIGRMIKALEEAGVRDNTIIIVWSDHGYHLGDMGIWGKATNYEIATRVPMMIWTPNMIEKNRGRQTNALIELVDIYPTLCELAGLDKPDYLDGTSFMPLIKQPDMPWKTAAFSQFPSPALREWGSIPLRQGMRETYFGPLLKEVEERIIIQQKEKWNRDLFENNLFGYAMRTEQYRLVAWKDRTKPTKEPLFVELYDHKTDSTESVNIANENKDIVADLLVQLNKGLQGRLPN